MKKSLCRSEFSSISGPRWASYAAAAVASASIGVSAEASIHYFVENVSLNDTDPSHAVRSVDDFSVANAIGIGFVHDLGPSGGLAGFAMGGASAIFAGIINPTSSHQRYGLRLASNILVNAQPFIYNYGSNLAILASNAGNGLSQWSTPGTGFLAFAFNGAFGEQVRLDQAAYGFRNSNQQFHSSRLCLRIRVRLLDRPSSRGRFARFARHRRRGANRLADSTCQAAVSALRDHLELNPVGVRRKQMGSRCSKCLAFSARKRRISASSFSTLLRPALDSLPAAFGRAPNAPIDKATVLEYPVPLPPWLRCSHCYDIALGPLVCTLSCISPYCEPAYLTASSCELPSWSFDPSPSVRQINATLHLYFDISLGEPSCGRDGAATQFWTCRSMPSILMWLRRHNIEQGTARST